VYEQYEHASGYLKRSRKRNY